MKTQLFLPGNRKKKNDKPHRYCAYGILWSEISDCPPPCFRFIINLKIYLCVWSSTSVRRVRVTRVAILASPFHPIDCFEKRSNLKWLPSGLRLVDADDDPLASKKSYKILCRVETVLALVLKEYYVCPQKKCKT